MANRDILLAAMGALDSAHDYLGDYLADLDRENSLSKADRDFFNGALRSLAGLDGMLHARPELAEFVGHLKPPIGSAR